MLQTEGWGHARRNACIGVTHKHTSKMGLHTNVVYNTENKKCVGLGTKTASNKTQFYVYKGLRTLNAEQRRRKSPRKHKVKLGMSYAATCLRGRAKSFNSQWTHTEPEPKMERTARHT